MNDVDAQAKCMARVCRRW